MIEQDIYKKRYLVLQDISHALVMTDGVARLADYLLDVAIRHVDAASGSLMLVNDQGDLSILSSRGLDEQFIRDFAARGGDAVSCVLQQRQKPIVVRDIARHPRFRSPDRPHYRTRSFLSCPILFRRRLLGLVNINDKRTGAPFTRDELDLLQIVANNAAVALENARLLNRLQSAAANVEHINRRLIDADIVKTEFLMSMSHELRTPLNAIKGAAYYLDARDAELSPGERREFHGILSSEVDSLSGTVEDLIRFLEAEDETLLLDRTPINIADILAALPGGQLGPALSVRGIRLAVVPPPRPLWIVGDRLRIMQVFVNLLTGISHYLAEDDSVDLSAASDDACITIRMDLSRPLPRTVLQQINNDAALNPTVASDSRVRIRLARSTASAHRWTLLAENGAASSSIVVSCPRNRDEALHAYIRKSIDRFVDFISDSLDIDICSVMLSDDLTGELRVACSRGLDEKVVRATSIRQGDKIAGWVALEGRPLFVSDVETDSRFLKKNIPQYNSKSLMSFPLKVDDRVIGVLNLNNKKSSEPFNVRDYERALTMIDSFVGHLRHAYDAGLSETEIAHLITLLDTATDYPYPPQHHS